ncbi:MAG: GIY-YIG nuclease family protein [Hyphomicrobiaceae bacterium]
MPQREHTYFVYILASKQRGTLYVGVTNDIYRRVLEHREGQGSKFTAKYGVRQLVWYEIHQDIEVAIQREKSLKEWQRQWKISLIEEDNPHWDDLFIAML